MEVILYYLILVAVLFATLFALGLIDDYKPSRLDIPVKTEVAILEAEERIEARKDPDNPYNKWQLFDAELALEYASINGLCALDVTGFKTLEITAKTTSTRSKYTGKITINLFIEFTIYIGLNYTKARGLVFTKEVNKPIHGRMSLAGDGLDLVMIDSFRFMREMGYKFYRGD